MIQHSMHILMTMKYISPFYYNKFPSSSRVKNYEEILFSQSAMTNF